MATELVTKDFRDYSSPEAGYKIVNGNVLVLDKDRNIIYGYDINELKGGSESVLQWENSTTYPIDFIVEYNLKLWKSKVNDNLNNPPVEGSNWTEVTKSESNGFGRYTVGVYTLNPTLVVNGNSLYLLNESEPLPFESTDFAAELNAGIWESVGGGTDGKIRITANDTTNDYLDPKVSVGDEFTKEILNQGGNESLRLKFKGWIFNAARSFKHILVSNADADYTQTFQNKDGTIALLSDITGGIDYEDIFFEEVAPDDAKVFRPFAWKIPTGGVAEFDGTSTIMTSSDVAYVIGDTVAAGDYLTVTNDTQNARTTLTIEAI